MINPLYSLTGFGSGVLVGFCGAGGGALMTAVLLAFGVHIETAVGTSLIYAAVTKGVGAGVHGMGGTVDWGIVGRLASGSVPATVLTLLALARWGKALNGGHDAIASLLGFGMLLLALVFVGRMVLPRLFSGGRLGPGGIAVLLPLLGAVLGVLVTLSSVGAGAMVVTILLLLYPDRPSARMVGSDLAHAAILTLLAGVGHWMMGAVDWRLLASLLVGSIPGIVIGALLSSRLSDRVLRPVLAVAVALVLVAGGWRAVMSATKAGAPVDVRHKMG